jgi:hypothetical protein
MSRTATDWISYGKINYKDFCKENPEIKLTYNEWRNILYTFSEEFKHYILETGEKAKLPFGFGDFSIGKKIRKKMKGPNDEFINLPVDWKKTKEKGKKIYNFNYHTEGYFFGWIWFKQSVLFKHSKLWYFKPSRVTSRLLAHYIHSDKKYMNMYREWESKT